MRNFERYPVPPGRNSMHYWPRLAGFWRSGWNLFWISVARYMPWLNIKSAIYRMLGMKVGKDAAFGLMVMVDIFFPQDIAVGDNTIIGYNTTILTHEYLIREWRRGRVEIGHRVMIGANCTVLPGVTIGDGAVVGAHSLVNRSIPAGAFAAGVPARVITTEAQKTAQKNSE